MKLFYQLNYTLIKREIRFKTTKSHKSPVFFAENCIYAEITGLFDCTSDCFSTKRR